MNEELKLALAIALIAILLVLFFFEKTRGRKELKRVFETIDRAVCDLCEEIDWLKKETYRTEFTFIFFNRWHANIHMGDNILIFMKIKRNSSGDIIMSSAEIGKKEA